MKPNKRLAAGLAGALAVGGLAVVSLSGTPALAAAPGALICNTGSNAPAFQTNYNSTNTFDLTPAAVNAGSPVTVTYTATSGLDNASPATLNAGTAQPLVFTKITWADSSVSKVVAATAPGSFPAVNIPSTFPATNTGPFTATTTVTAAGNGVANAVIDQLVVNGGLPTYCGTAGGNFPAAGDPDVGTAGNYTAAAGINGPFGVPVGYVVNGAYQAFTASGGPVVIKVSSNTPDFGSASTSVTGPNAAVSSISGQATGVIAYARASQTVAVTGTVWGLNKVAADFTVTVNGAAATTTLSTNGSGNLTGGIVVPAGATVGLGSISIVEGGNSATITPFTVLGARTATLVPTSGGPGQVVNVTGSNWNPSSAIQSAAKITNPNGFCNVPDGPIPGPPCNDPVGNFPVGPFIVGGNTTVNGSSSATGTININVTVTDPASINVTTNEVPASIGNSVAAPFTVNKDRCIAQTGNVTGGGGCNTEQSVTVTVLAGNLTQRAYPTGGNPNATTIALGSITTPLGLTAVPGNMNSITVSDNRGGDFGWSLNAVLTDFTGALGNTIDNSNLTITPSCAISADGAAFGYGLTTNDPAGTPIPFYSSALSATGVSSATSSNLNGTVNLCTKDGTNNLTTQTTGGVYTVIAPVSLNVPAFQAADVYSAKMTITLI